MRAKKINIEISEYVCHSRRGALCQQPLCRFQSGHYARIVPVGLRQIHRRLPFRVFYPRVGTLCEELRHNLQVSVPSGTMERCSPLLVLRADVRLVREEELDHLLLALVRRDV